jgi:hypothetical protein
MAKIIMALTGRIKQMSPKLIEARINKENLNPVSSCFINKIKAMKRANE